MTGFHLPTCSELFTLLICSFIMVQTCSKSHIAAPAFRAGGAGCRNGIASARRPITPSPIAAAGAVVPPASAQEAEAAADIYRQKQAPSCKPGGYSPAYFGRTSQGAIGAGASLIASRMSTSAALSAAPSAAMAASSMLGAPGAASSATQPATAAVRAIAKGAFAAVRVEMAADGSAVAVKTYEQLVDRKGSERQDMHELHLAHELRLVGLLTHPNIIAPHTVRSGPNHATELLMEYAPHGSLEDYAKRHGRDGVPEPEGQVGVHIPVYMYTCTYTTCTCTTCTCTTHTYGTEPAERASRVCQPSRGIISVWGPVGLGSCRFGVLSVWGSPSW